MAWLKTPKQQTNPKKSQPQTNHSIYTKTPMSTQTNHSVISPNTCGFPLSLISGLKKKSRDTPAAENSTKVRPQTTECRKLYWSLEAKVKQPLGGNVLILGKKVLRSMRGNESVPNVADWCHRTVHKGQNQSVEYHKPQQMGTEGPGVMSPKSSRAVRAVLTLE